MPKLPQKLILKTFLSPGDIACCTNCVVSLHETYPGEYLTDVRTTCGELWENNPHITSIKDDDPKATVIDMEYPTIHQSNQRPVTFIEAYATFLGEKLGRPLRATTNRPMLYLSDEEKKWINQVREKVTDGKDIPFWLLNAGVKKDYTAKQWPVESYQDVVNQTRGLIQWVQIGCLSHDHEKLDGVIDFRGQTTTRQLIRLAYHAKGGLGPVTFLQHLMAAFEKPYVCLLGGREPLPWVQYPLQHTLHTIGLLPCCRDHACWKSRVVKTGDADAKDLSLCEMPVLGLKKPVGRCMASISSLEVVKILERMIAS